MPGVNCGAPPEKMTALLGLTWLLVFAVAWRHTGVLLAGVLLVASAYTCQALEPRLPPRPLCLGPLLPAYERAQWLARHPFHRLVHSLAFVLLTLLRPLLSTRTPHSVGREAAHLIAADDAADTAAPPPPPLGDSFHLEALEHQLPDFADWLPYGPIYPFAKQVANKLRLGVWRAEHPGVADVNLKLVLWVVGLPRTGSTIFHKLMSFDRHARTVRAWELRHPVPPVRPEHWEADKRHKDFESGSRLGYALHPEMTKIHHVTADDPDECIWGMVDGAEPLHLWGALNQPDSYRWYTQRPGGLTPMYAHYRELLQVLCSPEGQPVDSHMVLKSPHHTFHMPSIAEAFGPDASTFVWLHRHPFSVVASCCSMNLHFREYMSADFESPATLGQRTLARLAECMRKALRDRAALEAAGHRFIDIHYDAFVADSVGTIRQLYQQLELPLETEFVEEIEAKLSADRARRQAAKHSKHTYTLEAYGITKEVRPTFSLTHHHRRRSFSHSQTAETRARTGAPRWSLLHRRHLYPKESPMR